MRWVICLVALLWGMTPRGATAPPGDGPLDSVELADGRMLNLEAVSRWPQTVRIGGREFQTSAPSNSLVIWLSIPVVPKPANERYWMGMEAPEVVADSGERFAGHRKSSRDMGGRVLVTHYLDSFPRRDKFFSLTGAVDNLPYSFRIKNPVYGSTFPVWTADRLPATNRVDGVDFVMRPTHLSVSENGVGMPKKLDAFMAGKLVNEWFRMFGVAYDATGNRGQPSTNERIWKIRFTVNKTDRAPWFTDEYIDLPLSRLPGEGEFETLEIQRSLKGQHFGRAWIGGPGSFKMRDGLIVDAKSHEPGRTASLGFGGAERWVQWSYAHHWLMMTNVAGRRAGLRRTVSLIDADGIKTEIRGRGGFGGPGNLYMMPHRFQFDFRLDRLARKLGKEPPYTLERSTRGPYTVRIGIQETRHVDFYIDVSQLRRVVYPPGATVVIPADPGEEPFPGFFVPATKKVRRVYPID